MQSKYPTLPFLPETHLKQIAPGITLVQPLSRRGHGPGLVLLVSDTGVASSSTLRIEDGIPSPLMKWAEEGYTVVEVTPAALDNGAQALALAVKELADCSTTQPRGVVGLVCKSTSCPPLKPQLT